MTYACKWWRWWSFWWSSRWAAAADIWRRRALPAAAVLLRATWRLCFLCRERFACVRTGDWWWVWAWCWRRRWARAVWERCPQRWSCCSWWPRGSGRPTRSSTRSWRPRASSATSRTWAARSTRTPAASTRRWCASACATSCDAPPAACARASSAPWRSPPSGRCSPCPPGTWRSRSRRSQVGGKATFLLLSRLTKFDKIKSYFLSFPIRDFCLYIQVLNIGSLSICNATFEKYACHVLLFSHDVHMLSVVEPHVLGALHPLNIS